jgi:uncharacterized protein YbcI
MSFANRQASDDGRGGLIVAEQPRRQRNLNDEFLMRSGEVRNHLSTALVKLYREIFGRGPVRTTTYEFDAGYVTFLRDVLVPHERALVLGGRADLVRETRMAIRETERESLITEIQRLTGRPVLHDSFQFQPERDLAIELFWVPKPFADEAGSAQAHQGIAPTGSRYRGVISGER